MTTPSDRDLMRRWVSDRDVGAFEELVGRWQNRLFAFFFKATGNSDAAEDLRQEVLERVWRYADRQDPKFAVSTWIFAIATNCLRTWIAAQQRSRRRGVMDLEDEQCPEPVDPAPNPAQKALEADYHVALRRQIGKLDPESRGLLLLRFEEDLSYAQIAQVHQLPETTVKSRVYSTLRRLRGALERLDAMERIKTP